ncbi:MAG: hypothetical protein AAGA55_04650, partial [Planctomycetota bacterium]
MNTRRNVRVGSPRARITTLAMLAPLLLLGLGGCRSYSSARFYSHKSYHKPYYGHHHSCDHLCESPCIVVATVSKRRFGASYYHKNYSDSHHYYGDSYYDS